MSKFIGQLICALLLMQNICAQNSSLKLGVGHSGILFGNNLQHNGIRFSLKDTNHAWVNGTHGSFITENQQANGIVLSLLLSGVRLVNGIQTGLITGGDKVNGISIAPIAAFHGKINGLALSGLATYFDTTNGVQLNVLGTTPIDFMSSKVINGLGIGGLYFNCVNVNGVLVSSLLCYAEQVNGVSISCVNVAEELHGVQIGLLNYAANNKKPFKKLPFINFHFRRKEKS